MKPDACDDPNDELLCRFIADTCATPERAEVEAWLRRDPGNERRLGDIRRIWLASRSKPSRDVDRLWTRLRHATEREQPAVDGGTASDRTAVRMIRDGGLTRLTAGAFSAARWAAVLLVIAGGAALFVSLSHPAQQVRARVAEHVYATGPAQTANIRLRDGSRVMLAPESRLRVPDDFGSDERLVSIEGQGFFDVMHDDVQPFRVRAKGAVAEDIGTRFDLRAYADEPGVVVIVADGAVTLGHYRSDGPARGAEGAIARRGERARTGGPDSTTTVDRVSLRLVAWTEGRLEFVKTPLAEIARTIGRWYDLDVRVPDAALRQRLITADFGTQSPKEMIEALATAIGGEAEQHGRVLTIRAKP